MNPLIDRKVNLFFIFWNLNSEKNHIVTRPFYLFSLSHFWEKICTNFFLVLVNLN